MEIILELVIQAFGWLFQFVGELLVQLVGQFLVDLIGHKVQMSFRRSEPVQSWASAIGYLIFGATTGAISLLFVPDPFIKLEWLRVLNLVATPLVAGLVMAWVGSWRRHRNKTVIRLESFSYGLSFAFAMTFVRHLYAH